MAILRQTASFTLVPVAVFVITFFPVGTARADDVPATPTVRTDALERDLAYIRTTLSTPEAVARLADAGTTPEAALQKIERLTPAEVHYLAERMQQEPKEGEGAIGIIIGVLLIVLIVVVILALVDKKIEVKDRGAHAPSRVREGPSLARGAVLN